MKKSEVLKKMSRGLRGKLDIEKQLEAGLLTDNEIVMFRCLIQLCDTMAVLVEKEETDRVQRS